MIKSRGLSVFFFLYNLVVDPILGYIFIYLTLVIVNAIPFIMPPSWLLLILFAVNLKLPVLPLVVVGLAGSSSGRTILYFLASNYFSRLLPAKRRDHLKELGEILKTKRRIFIPLILTFSLLPVPTDDVFIAAGLTKFKLRTVLVTFILGRFPINLILVYTSTFASQELINKINDSVFSWPALLVELLGISFLFLITEVRWKSALHTHYRKFLSSSILE